ncbi:hypothetical protein LJC04_04050 [Ruminococcaceae bacterium OttesenSCG-928-O06]|nr:hypothetical protein [Ruminococcaceae bacterium OttesenSCG-928-O06]
MSDVVIDLNDFHLIAPTPKKDVLAFSVFSDGALHLNGKLRQAIKTNGIQIRLHNTGKCFLLAECERSAPDAHVLPQNGRMRVPALPQELEGFGYKLPVRFLAQWDDSVNMWRAEHDASYMFPTPLPPQKPLPKMPAKPRKTKLERMLPTGDEL